MIINKTKIYAKVWKVNPAESGKYIDLQISTSEKDESDNYINSGWFPRVIGHAVNSLKNVREGDRIEITSSKFTNERKELEDGSKKSFFRFIIFEAAILSDTKNNSPAPTPANNVIKAANKSSAKPKQANNDEDPF